jgi:hypothetical protein
LSACQRAVQDIATEEGRQADVKASMKAKLAEIERTQLAIAVSRKEEHRDVEVDIWHDYQRMVVQEIRRDTGEIISTRVMSDSERQQGFHSRPHQPKCQRSSQERP